MRILYLDCFSGISGDMTVAALVDAGADQTYIEQELMKLALEPFSLEWKRVVKNGISSLKMDVLEDPEHRAHHHRHYSDIADAIRKAGFHEKVETLALAIFDKIAHAESKIHNIPVADVHFHEVGAIDSIADVVAAALAIHNLQIDTIVASPIPLGSGTVRCDHGIYPVPAPATLELMKGLPIAPSSISAELTTPTGAGIIAAAVQSFSTGVPAMTVESIGYGAGTRDLANQPNVVRAIIGRTDHHLPIYEPLQSQESFLIHEEAPHHHDHHHDHTYNCHDHSHDHHGREHRHSGHKHGHDHHGHGHDHDHLAHHHEHDHDGHDQPDHEHEHHHAHHHHTDGHGHSDASHNLDRPMKQ